MLTVFVVALVVRAAFAVVSYFVNDQWLIPDEGQYIGMARYIAEGKSAEDWFPGYGQSLYDNTLAFTPPLVWLFEVFGPNRLVGQLFSVGVGTAVATLTTWLGTRFLRPGYALLAGLVVALLPSQILFSSVVLREAHVWLGLTLIATGVALLTPDTRRRVVWLGPVLVVAGAFLLDNLRQQAFVVGIWSAGIALVFLGRRWWLPRAALGVAVLLLVPVLAGQGLLGRTVVDSTAPRLGALRETLAADAQSAFVKPPPKPAPAATPSKKPAAPAKPVPPVKPVKPVKTVPGSGGQLPSDANDARAGFSHLPRGLVDVTLRPLPWQAGGSTTLSFARVETPIWYLLYLLAIVGVIAAVANTRARRGLLFPALAVGMLLGASALTEGNLGSAFRHRESIAWGLALCAAFGLQWLVDRRRAARSPVPAGTSPG